MHPLEQLRFVARGWESMDEVPVQEVAAMLAELAEESPTSLLHACRRLIEHFPSSGRLWWLSARALSAPEPVEGIWEAADELIQDPTPAELAKALPAGASVSVLGPSSQAVTQVLRSLKRAARKQTGNKQTGSKPTGSKPTGSKPTNGPAGGKARDVAKPKPGPNAQVVVVPVLAAGPEAVLVYEAAESQLPRVAASGRALWAVVPKGVVLPGPLWAELLKRTSVVGGAREVAPEAFAAFAGPDGLAGAAALLSAPACPPVAELLGWRS